MRIVTTTGGFGKNADPVKITELICRAGFEGIDIGFDNLFAYCPDRVEDTVKEMRKVAERYGTPFVQSHAPIPKIRTVDDNENIDDFLKKAAISIRLSGLCGVENVIVHPVRLLSGTHEEQLAFNLFLYNELVSIAEESNTRLAIENMCGFKPHLDGYKVKHVCKTPEELCAYIDAFDSSAVVGCLDTGHAFISGESPAEFVRMMGRDKLFALHIQDCDGVSDTHTLPYLSKIEWEPFIRALADIDYRGDITLEAVLFTAALPEKLFAAGLALAKAEAEYIRDKVLEYKEKAR